MKIAPTNITKLQQGYKKKMSFWYFYYRNQNLNKTFKQNIIMYLINKNSNYCQR